MCPESGHAFRESGLPLQGAEAIVRGTLRLLLEMGFSPAPEVILDNGRRADLLAVDRKGSLLIVEVKSSVADFQSDRKWPDYLPHCDSFYFAVDTAFPAALIPESCGLMVADAYGAAIVRPALEQRLGPARRRAVTLRLARTAADRMARQILPLAP
ncbi:MAG: MmcB family DNA repair protein [Sneathiellaceae bacterium]